MKIAGQEIVDVATTTKYKGVVIPHWDMLVPGLKLYVGELGLPRNARQICEAYIDKNIPLKDTLTYGSSRYMPFNLNAPKPLQGTTLSIIKDPELHGYIVDFNVSELGEQPEIILAQKLRAQRALQSVNTVVTLQAESSPHLVDFDELAATLQPLWESLNPSLVRGFRRLVRSPFVPQGLQAEDMIEDLHRWGFANNLSEPFTIGTRDKIALDLSLGSVIATYASLEKYRSNLPMNWERRGNSLALPLGRRAQSIEPVPPKLVFSAHRSGNPSERAVGIVDTALQNKAFRLAHEVAAIFKPTA